MEERTTSLRRALRPLLGNVIGVGIFGLPYAFAQAGFGIGVVALAVSGVVGCIALLMYADLALQSQGHARFVGLVRENAGPVAGGLAAIAFFGALYGAIVAYIIIGGTFAHTFFSPFLGGTIFLYRVLFFLFSSVVVLGGVLTVARLQGWFITAYLVLLVVFSLIAAPSIDVGNFAGLVPEHLFLPFGVCLFAFIGFGAVPEMRDILGRQRGQLRRVIVVGMLVIAVLYLLFTTAVVGVTGPNTSPDALRGLAAFFGPTFLLLGAAIGLCTVLTATITHMLVATHTWVYDYKLRYLAAWVLAVAVPLCIFLLGATDFIRVVDITGGVGGGLAGLALIAAYEKLRLQPRVAKRMLAIPQWLVFVTACVFLANIVFVLV